MPFILNTNKNLVAEGNWLYFAVLRVGDSSLRESVIVSTSSGSAKEGADYDPIKNRRLIFLPRMRQVNQRIKIHKDGLPEFTENFRVQLLVEASSAGGVTLGEPNVMEIHILDIDT
jgi:Calx-beta domain